MPRLIYGTAWKKEKTPELVAQAVQMGFAGLDTAGQPKHYSEEGLGQGIKAVEKNGIQRNALFLQTKFTSLGGQDPSRLPYDPRAPLDAQVVQSFASSKKNLATHYVDSLLLHSPMRTFEETLVVWRAMEGIHRTGEAKLLGISNCYELDVMKKLHQNAEVKPSVLQNRFYQDTGYDKALRSWCQDKGIIYQSFWTLTANPHILRNQVIQSMAQRRQKTPAQIFFRYLTQEGIVPLTGTTSGQHMKEDLEIFDFELSSVELKAVEGLLT